jgi:hypothetical protein
MRICIFVDNVWRHVILSISDSPGFAQIRDGSAQGRALINQLAFGWANTRQGREFPKNDLGQLLAGLSYSFIWRPQGDSNPVTAAKETFH